MAMNWVPRSIFMIVLVLLTFLLACQASHSAGIVYSRDQLIALNKPGVFQGERLEIPNELRKRSRGCRAGVKRRKKKRRYKPYIPAIIMGNVRSLPNKVDELGALAASQAEYRQCSIMCFTETWLHEEIPDSDVTISGFQTVRADRNHRQSGKRKGGGLAMLVSHKWCNPKHITVKEQLCTPDIELMAVSLRPYYIPREFSHAIVLVIYIPPSANAKSACDVIHTVTAKLQTDYPDAFIALSGDFNHVSLSSSLRTFKQFVTCKTRENKTLDLFYANVKEAYSSTPLPPLGKSDHNLVYLEPLYKPLVQRQKVTTRTVRRWSLEKEEAIRDCFNTTLWEEMCHSFGDDIDGLCDFFTGYIHFCQDIVAPTKTVQCFPNNKPWITSDLKALLNEKKRAFREGNKEEQKRVQRELKVKIRANKGAYRRKIENKLQENSMKEVWSGMRTITGHTGASQPAEGDQAWADEINLFFNRFDSGPVAQTAPVTSSLPPTSVLSACLPSVSSCPSCGLSPPTEERITFTSDEVRMALKRLQPGKAAGPDGITSRIIRLCANELCGVLQYIYNLSMSLERPPVVWKTSCLIPVPKKSWPKELNDYRPVALTSHLMKVLERLVLARLRPLVMEYQDPLQFGYQANMGVDDAILYLLHRVHSHLETAGSTLRLMFCDFSSAFNTIQPARLREKMLAMQVDGPLVAWISDYLTSRLQYVRLQDCVSRTLASNTGAPQGTVLAPFLFNLYTSDFTYNSELCHLQKFADDSVIVGCVRDGQEGEYRRLVSDFAVWCSQNHLHLNIKKTKEMIVDFLKMKTPISPVSIGGQDVECVPSYKYLGVHINNKLDWSENTLTVYKKGQSCLHFLRRLRSFDVQGPMLDAFYHSVVESALFFGVSCWGSGLKAADENRINKLLKKASSVLGTNLDPVGVVAERRMLKRFLAIMDNPSHPLHDTVVRQRSLFSNRFTLPRCSTERHRRSFLPTAMRLYNSSMS